MQGGSEKSFTFNLASEQKPPRSRGGSFTFNLDNDQRTVPVQGVRHCDPAGARCPHARRGRRAPRSLGE